MHCSIHQILKALEMIQLIGYEQFTLMPSGMNVPFI